MEVIKNVAEFIVMTVIVKAIIVKYLADGLLKIVRKVFNNERDAIIRTHFFENHTTTIKACYQDACAAL